MRHSALQLNTVFRVVAILAWISLISGCQHTATGRDVDNTNGALPRVEPLDECFAEPPEGLEIDADIHCGYVVVPEFHHGGEGQQIKLGYTRLESRHGAGNSPLFMLAGGPGQSQASTNIFLLFQPELLGEVLDSRDIVLVEQRGTRFSKPFLDCPVSASARWVAYEQGLDEEEAAQFELDAIRQCVANYRARSVNFDAYNSVENAADVNAVREALGYERIIYYGASYGAQLGQHVMRDFPGILEAVVLDGAAALSRKSWVEERAMDAQWGIDNLASLCEEDTKCRQAYDIPALVDAALSVFADGPLPFRYTDPSDPSLSVDVEVTIDDMVGYIYAEQGSRIGSFSLPAILTQLVEGAPQAIAETLGTLKAQNLIASRAGPATQDMAPLMHLAMVCSDDPVRSPGDAKTDGVGAYAKRFGEISGLQYAPLCALIDVRELPDSTDVDVSSDIPALLLGGDLDVATPVFRSEEVADALPNGTLVVFSGTTHVQIAGANFCAAEVMTRFIRDPAAELDTSCSTEPVILGFVLPDGSMSTE